MSISLSQMPRQTQYNLSGYYSQEIWDLTEHPSFVDLTENQRNLVGYRSCILDFTICQNPLMKNEIKFYCQNLLEIENRKLSYFATLVGGITLIIKFTNQIFDIHERIVDKEYNGIVDKFTAHLKDNGYKTYVTAKNVLSEQMEQVEYQNPTPYLRFFMNMYKFLNNDLGNKQGTKKNFFEFDKWDIRELPFKVKGFNPSRPRYTISFENIVQPEIKAITKKFIFERLKSRKYTTCMDDLKGINQLSKYLSIHHSEIKALKQLDRDMIEGFLGYINSDQDLMPRTKSSRIGTVKSYFDICTLYKWENAPDRTLLLTSDIKKKYKILPKFYEDDILYEINKHLEHLPVQVARMVYVVQQVGMRISELCSLKVDCLRKDTEKDDVLSYYQEKTNELNRVPIKKEVALALEEAIKCSREQFGDDINYVFMQDQTRPIGIDTFSYHMNQLVKKFNIIDSNGQLVRIKAHHFRGTVATKYANMGMSLNLIRILLGQRSLGAIRHYVEILEVTVTESMQNILMMQDQMIQNIGKKDAIVHLISEDRIEIPLANGSCAKPLSEGKCSHANACYTCGMFKADAKNIELFKHQLIVAQSNVEMAKINGFVRVQETNEELVDKLTKIIASIERVVVDEKH